MSDYQGPERRRAIIEDDSLVMADTARPWWGDPKTLIWNIGPVTFGFFCLLAILFGWLPSPVLTTTTSTNTIATSIQTQVASLQTQISTVIERLVRLESQIKSD